VAAVVALGLPVGGGGARRYVVIALLAAALGLQNATVRRLAVADVTTTVLTLTLTGLAADSWLAGGRSPRAGSRVAAVGLMAAGRWWACYCCEWTSHCRCWRLRCWSRWPRWGSGSAGKSVPFALA
jgi:uncharacterized membrane protein YoaK (UPF0700 family)